MREGGALDVAVRAPEGEHEPEDLQRKRARLVSSASVTPGPCSRRRRRRPAPVAALESTGRGATAGISYLLLHFLLPITFPNYRYFLLHFLLPPAKLWVDIASIPSHKIVTDYKEGEREGRPN